ncbi:hypothetical protein IQ13_0366 [Lacibacter cauensis]|uniref:Uncharacterized protein n=1 Tax=Lacibacter cauensis TaxID=510947 RepID=A0A562SV70_9BACT|nr:hypothetical protein [Lacibacter cauensis]TWI85209.1 hypothetical protein IQ13_0366 [Lacibacter cauensis]
MFTHLLVIGSMTLLFLSVQWLSQRSKQAQKTKTTATTFDQKQEAAA